MWLSCDYHETIMWLTISLSLYRPSLLLHDHCYNNKQKTDTNNNTNNTNEAIISNGDTTITNGDITNIRYCILCATRGDQPSMVCMTINPLLIPV